ncbi:MAG: M23 family metallopeptidase [Treponema sp.]|nr:M23 family metallopeptidase [Treponema sp.]
MQRKSALKGLALLGLLLLASAKAAASEPISIQTERVPLIKSTKRSDKDIMLKQFDDEVEQQRQLLASGKEVFPSFYAYKIESQDRLFALASRFCIRYDSFCVLNGITSADSFLKGKVILLPTLDGIFVPLDEDGALSALEILLQKNRLALLEETGHLRYNIDGKNFAFFPGEKFTTTERAFFLDTSMQLPVKNYRISSRYGQRENPFDKGRPQFHKGVDMAVPEDSSVFACKGGTITGIGENRAYGKWIQIDHGGGMSSFYAHLSLIQDDAKKGKIVRAGELIAKSGSTGQVTGPHLHFEIRLNGNAVDPEAYGNF